VAEAMPSASLCLYFPATWAREILLYASLRLNFQRRVEHLWKPAVKGAKGKPAWKRKAKG
jgi:hypothetical protein